MVGDWFHRPPGGEAPGGRRAPTDVVPRVRDFVDELDRAVPGRRGLLVAHDAIAVAVRLVYGGLGTAFPGRLIRCGDTAHLGREGGRGRFAGYTGTVRVAV
ncbi:histidine phosphatase family protein [Streptomyces europaeiscabiei]|uniref:hypothetical protein n=1 Tax=Streptomyces europaeiscabiei TaxID=146819 RepID=UPI0038F71876